RDGEDPGAAADVEQRSALEVEQELEAEPRRRVPPGPERPARVDHDGDRVRRRRLPRRPEPERPDARGPVALAPAVLPALLDALADRAAERLPEALLAGAVGVRGELDVAGVVALLEPLGEELEHHGACLLRPARWDAHRHASQAAQRNALF